jgi:CheY-like chemotaxis protein
VLVADDEAQNRALLEELLSKVGFATQAVATGEEAIAVHDAWKPDLVLMDLRMPGIGGREAIRRLRAAGATTPIVVLTASAFGEQAHEIHEDGADDIHLKPYREADLLQKIGEWLHVRYIHEASPAPPEVKLATEPTSSEGLLRAVPVELLDRLHCAVQEARVGQIELLATQVAEHTVAGAEQIRALARDFRYDSLAAVLGAARAAAT